ncbi:MAG: outer membrane protein transport protein [Gammaproteobacteria bacterium]
MEYAKYPSALQRIAFLSALLITPGAVAAGGFQIFEQSVKGLGQAFAGSAASADDAATVFFNPAGMTQLPGSRIQAAANIIATRADFVNEGSVTGTGQPLQGSAADGGILTAVWNGYVTHALNNRVFVGFGVNTPFGLRTDYPRSWIGRYHAVDSDLRTLNLSPVVAIRLHDSLSIGVGIDVQYVDVLLSNAIDFGAFLAPSGRTSPGSDDGFQEIKADDWGLGYNLGLLFTPNENTRIGVAFRSGIDLTLRGEAKFEKSANVERALAATGFSSLFRNTGVRATATLPGTLSVGAYQRLNSRWALLAGLSWTRWDSLEDPISIRFDNPDQPLQTLSLNYNNAFRYSVGANYYASERLTLRSGIAYDETPIPDAASRIAGLPDADRFWLAAGLTYAVTKNLFIDFAYAHLFIDDAEIQNTLSSAVPRLQSQLTGRFEGAANIISAQVGWRF